MGKFSARERLSKKEIDELFIDFAKALASVHSAVESANFIKDLLSEPEVVMLARRLQIARLLDEGLTYNEIRKTMKASNTTITKVQTWMSLYGEGYRMVLKRTKLKSENKEDDSDPLSWAQHKRKYPMYYWPELLLKEIVRSANKREKQKLLKVVRDLREKTKLTKELTKILQFDKSYHTQ